MVEVDGLRLVISSISSSGYTGVSCRPTATAEGGPSPAAEVEFPPEASPLVQLRALQKEIDGADPEDKELLVELRQRYLAFAQLVCHGCTSAL